MLLYCIGTVFSIKCCDLFATDADEWDALAKEKATSDSSTKSDPSDSGAPESAITLMERAQHLARTHRFIFNNEAELQLQVAELLTSNRLTFEREFRISTGDRPDFFHLRTGLAIEVKIDGSPYAIARQIHRYIRHPLVHAVLLISSRPIPLPSNLEGKPIAQASTWRGAL